MSVSLNATDVHRKVNVVYIRTCSLDLIVETADWRPPLLRRIEKRQKRVIPPDHAQALVRVVCYCVTMLLR